MSSGNSTKRKLKALPNIVRSGFEENSYQKLLLFDNNL